MELGRLLKYACAMARSRNRKRDVTSMHEAFAFMLILAQCFAMFPLCGISGPDYRSLKFTWKSLRALYCAFYVMLHVITLLFYLAKLFKKFSFGYFVSLVFFACSLASSLLFVKLAKDWYYMMKRWTKIDIIMSLHRYEFPPTLHIRLKMIAVLVMTAAAVEHSFFLAYAVVNSEEGVYGMDAINLFFENSHRHVFDFISYSTWMGFTCQMISIFSTFTWNYMDLFIMLISTAIAARFKQVTVRIHETANSRVKDKNYWMEIREDFNRLNILCKLVDHSVSDLILISFGNNLFFILIQLLNTLEPSREDDIIGRLYFVYSFGFLILRATAVCLLASKIDVESNGSIAVLSGLSNSIHNIETERLLQQIKMDPCCFTGRKFFRVKKSFILSVCGAIVTYELIFIQFNLHQ